MWHICKDRVPKIMRVPKHRVTNRNHACVLTNKTMITWLVISDTV